ncbi:DUF3644 domain-containing protein [Kangiella sp. TOML190]|uniref:DUF3644 domain-containing protein n=1 Tax=Kangiella sp. TOML190 TaxID=2931351 RepID=UPI00203B963C|nr:DUF3644 domain-containing protein [Kangiella sp. TOML190]
MKIPKSHSGLLELLQTKEKQSKKFYIKAILDATKWTESTFKTYWNKGQLSDFLSENNGLYEASNTVNLTEVEFSKLLSQSKHRRALGHNCKHLLSKALLKKSKENMMLALELYNRPSLENKMDSFVMCFCVAWEQLLKAQIMENSCEDAIYRKSKKAKIKETISLRACLDQVFENNSKVKANILKITDLRDRAVHLLMPEIQGLLSRIFQSGVLNYSKHFEDFTEQPFFNNINAGMISLVGDFNQPKISTLRNLYGASAEEIIELIEGLSDDVNSNNDVEFAIPLNVKLVFAKDSEDESGAFITLSTADKGVEGLKDAMIIEKPVDRERSHPYLCGKAIEEINKRLKEYDEEKLRLHLPFRNKQTNQPEVNQHCFRSLVFKNCWKKGNNEFHYKNSNPELHYYSEKAIVAAVKKIMSNESYLADCKKSYSHSFKNNVR